ncbi:hypothetical protein, conserved [Eimeria necatrix]|uniref:Uncharacterized protein n=1 Tax=Eimeria necatrix TaxID=51315 RepID=U6MZS0_9EIME|nr:hypothetical protein, conserved [Eimeria necatrix]CDJ69471.1 hypothetical protein, conserved [Eimeria necatrix]
MCQLCLNPAGEKSCCCFNLSLALLLVAAYYGLIGGLDIFQAQQTEPFAKPQFVGGVVNASIGVYVSLCALLGFLKLGLFAYVFTFAAFLLTLLNGIFKVKQTLNPKP